MGVMDAYSPIAKNATIQHFCFYLLLSSFLRLRLSLNMMLKVTSTLWVLEDSYLILLTV